jgi:type II secretory ATPase GspE/PulE/Tfp pilus assembly ATPase PilB-like protein/DNA-binding NarL/FixJ family response regulator
MNETNALPPNIELIPEKDISNNRGTRYALLLIDDDKSVLRSLKRIFAEENYSILTADDGPSALNLLATEKVNLVVCDYQMPGMNGIEVLRTIKARYPKIIRIMLTGNSETSVIMGAVKEGAVYKFLNKPWNDDDLKLSVSLALSQYELIKENQKLKSVASRQQSELTKLRRYVGSERSTLGQILIARGLLSAGQLEMAEEYRRQNNTILAKALLVMSMIDEADLLKVIQGESKTDFLAIDETSIAKEVAQLLPKEMCEAGCLIILSNSNGNIRLAMADPLSLDRIEHIKFTLQQNVVPLLARISDIERAIAFIYESSAISPISSDDKIDYLDKPNDIDIILDDEEIETFEQLMAKSATPPAVRMVNTIIAESIKEMASDIHIEPKANYTMVRLRCDGILKSILKFPAQLHLPVISRIKILARMDIAERRMPQDGRISVKTGNRFIDIRISSIPTINGEKIVCRLLDKNAAIRSLNDIGLSDEHVRVLRNTINIPQGMIIATGPTGSGKTTTLYSLMNEKMSPTLNFVTIEDPVEYFLEPASQIHMHHKIGLDFASALRATLRQDPDVILVGEIRDQETALIAFQAALTGHLVFTTLHTNSAMATVSRLLQMGIEPYLVASAVQMIIAQRLVRKICPYCKELAAYDKKTLELVGGDDSSFPDKLFIGKGCRSCENTGYFGRVGLYEILVMDEIFRQFLSTSYREDKLGEQAKLLGMRSLLEDGLTKVCNGETTLNELLRIIGPSIKREYRR